jgi:hypothetical protein
MRFQDAARDGRAVVYANVQADPLVGEAATLLADATNAERVLARAVMNGESSDPGSWRRAFPTLFGTVAADAVRARAEAVLDVSLAVAARGDQVRSQLRGAIVEELTQRLLLRRAMSVRRERRILFDGVAAEIHPYDVTVELGTRAEAYDCKWGARGIGADVLHQLDDARSHAIDEEENLHVGLVVFDTRLPCDIRLGSLTAPHRGISLTTIETLSHLATNSDRA